MVNGYICPRCGYNSNQKTHFRSHLERKKICELKNLDIDPREYKNVFLNNDIVSLFKEISELKKENKELKEKIDTTLINNKNCTVNIDNSIDNSKTVNIETVNIYKINPYLMHRNAG